MYLTHVDIFRRYAKRKRCVAVSSFLWTLWGKETLELESLNVYLGLLYSWGNRKELIIVFSVYVSIYWVVKQHFRPVVNFFAIIYRLSLWYGDRRVPSWCRGHNSHLYILARDIFKLKIGHGLTEYHKKNNIVIYRPAGGLKSDTKSKQMDTFTL